MPWVCDDTFPQSTAWREVLGRYGRFVLEHAAFEGVSISDFLRDAVFEKIEDSQDLADLRAAVAADDGARFSLSDVKSELGL